MTERSASFSCLPIGNVSALLQALRIEAAIALTLTRQKPEASRLIVSGRRVQQCSKGGTPMAYRRTTSQRLRPRCVDFVFKLKDDGFNTGQTADQVRTIFT